MNQEQTIQAAEQRLARAERNLRECKVDVRHELAGADEDLVDAIKRVTLAEERVERAVAMAKAQALPVENLAQRMIRRDAIKRAL